MMLTKYFYLDIVETIVEYQNKLTIVRYVYSTNILKK